MANKINIENYEAFLLDHIEGTISTEDLVSLQIFAAQHPHLNIALNNMELVELSAGTIPFEGKNELKKVSDEQFVAYIENELNSEEKNNIEVLCNSNPALATELKLFKKTLLVADETIVFGNKNVLKRTETKVFWLFPREVLAAAASLVLLLGLWFMFRGALSSDNLNSGKIEGINKIRTFALKTTNSASSFTVEKAIENRSSNDPVAYTTIKENSKKDIGTVKENSLAVNNNIPQKDTSSYKPKEISPLVKTDQLADNSAKPATTGNKAYVITEKAYDEDEKTVASNTKKGFWGRAMTALNGLNKLGVKKAKGTETVANNNEEYVLTMGNFKVENHKYNAE
jgi:hypothetical protein